MAETVIFGERLTLFLSDLYLTVFILVAVVHVILILKLEGFVHNVTFLEAFDHAKRVNFYFVFN